MGSQAYLYPFCALLLAGCGESHAPEGNQRETTASAAAAAPTVGTPQYKPWSEAGCRMTLENSAVGEHTAWVEANDHGLFFNTHINAIESLPRATDLELRLRADGDLRREIAARGQRGDEESDSTNYLSIILDAPQRRLVASAEWIAVVRGETTLIELPVGTLVDLETIADKCTLGGPGEYFNE